MIRLSKFVSGYKKDLWNPSDLEFEIGKTYTLIGPNGCGKSTFLKCLAKVKEDYQGDIEINPSNVSSQENQWMNLKDIEGSELKTIAWMPTYLDLQNWNVREFLYTNYQSRWDWSHELDQKTQLEFNDISSFLEIDEFLDQNIETLSDGQKQRVMLAKALGQKSKLLLLDEPISFIDLPHKFDFVKKLKSLSDQCVIYSSHDIKLSLKFCDFIIFIYKEEIIQMTPSEFINHPLVNEWLGESIHLM